MISIPAIVSMPASSCLWILCVTTATTGSEFMLACRWCNSTAACDADFVALGNITLSDLESLLLSFSLESSPLIYFGVLMRCLISASICVAFIGSASWQTRTPFLSSCFPGPQSTLPVPPASQDPVQPSRPL